MTPSGTSLLGLVKHVASVELGYPRATRPLGLERLTRESELPGLLPPQREELLTSAS